jgi:hypothetical protein
VADLFCNPSLSRSCRNCLFGTLAFVGLQGSFAAFAIAYANDFLGVLWGPPPALLRWIFIAMKISAFCGTMACVTWVLVLMHRTAETIEHALRSPSAPR